MNRAAPKTALLLLLSLCAAFLSAQEIPAAEALIFPLALALEYAGESGSWRPDWPQDMPPDAFKTVSGSPSRISVKGEDFELAFGLDAGGRPVEFPLMLNGVMRQAVLVYSGDEIREMIVDSEEPWNLEFLEYADSFPALVRVSRGEEWFFIYLSRGVNEIIETWYDVEGNALSVYRFSLIEIGNVKRIREIREFTPPDSALVTECFYDSWGFLTETLGPGGVYRALYFRDDLPRYWQRRPAEDNEETGSLSFQWDQKDLLLRVYGEGLDCRYDYTFDKEGNWTERRETRMIRNSGLLTPSPGTTIVRIIEYGKPE
jgi:hypothetical protein